MGKSSKDKRDIYYRLAKERGYRARSAFKLIHLNHHYHFLTPSTTRILDLCAAPGSWSQVLSDFLFSSQSPPSQNDQEEENPEKVDHSHFLNDDQNQDDQQTVETVEVDEREEEREEGRREGKVLVAVDIQPIAPLPHVTTLQRDITLPSTLSELSKNYFPPSRLAHVIVTDGAPDVTGAQDLDSSLHAQLLIASLSLCRTLLTQNGTFVGKVFNGEGIALFLVMSQRVFERVSLRKPEGSRGSSKEMFLVCEGFKASKWTHPQVNQEEEKEEGDNVRQEKVEEEGKREVEEEEERRRWERWEVGDLSEFDDPAPLPVSTSDRRKKKIQTK